MDAKLKLNSRTSGFIFTSDESLELYIALYCIEDAI